MNKILQVLYDFYCPVVQEDGLDIVRTKCDDVMKRHDITDDAFERAVSLRMQVDNFEVELERNKPVKPKRKINLDPTIIVPTIGVAVQAICTWMIERFQTVGGIFKSAATGWITSANNFGKFFTPKSRDNKA